MRTCEVVSRAPNGWREDNGVSGGLQGFINSKCDGKVLQEGPRGALWGVLSASFFAQTPFTGGAENDGRAHLWHSNQVAEDVHCDRMSTRGEWFHWKWCP